MLLFNQHLLKIEINKFQFPTDEKYKKIEKIIKDWQKSLKDGDLEKTKEKSIQGLFLEKFFGEILGYTTQIEGTEEYNIIQHPTSEIDAKEPDGALGIFTKDKKNYRAIIELKDASTILNKKQISRKNNQSPIEQAFSYLSKFDLCDWVIISNFKEIRLYHKSRGQILYEKIDILELDKKEQFEYFYFLLCKENLIHKDRKSILDKLVMDTAIREEEISKKFYKEFKHIRTKLFKHIIKRNSDIDKKLLLEKTQKILDRLIFIMFCEDTSTLLPEDAYFKNIYKRGISSFANTDLRVWNELKALFRSIDMGNIRVKPNVYAYDGGLFAKDEILDNLIIEDDVWKEIVYLSRYDFKSDLNVNILGHIFEQSLTDLEYLKSQIDNGDINFLEAKSTRKKEGIYYTPEYITHYIINQTIGKYLSENLDKIETLKILDPSCGSGAFLNQAHSFLKEHYNIIYQEKREKIESSNKRKTDLFSTSIEIDKSILLNNLYGVDLNRESVEITKLALWLKTARKTHPLENLDDNIKCGNSLIDDPEISSTKAFNWNEEFKTIIENGGFDIIVGNPPYGAELSKSTKAYFNNKYNIGSTDTAILFIKQSFDLSKENSRFGFIIPKAFCFASNYSKIREYIWDNIEIIIDCGKVWEEVKLEQVIIILKKGIILEKYASGTMKARKVKLLGNIDKKDCKEFGLLLNNVSNEEIEIAKRMKQNCLMLNDIAENIPGVPTQKYISKTAFDYEMIGGAEFSKWGIHTIKGKIDKKYVDTENAFIKEHSVLVQRIISHIANPIEHIQITACIPEDKYIEKLTLANTVNQIVIKENCRTAYTKHFLWTILNSKLLNWYAYRFIFCKAIRTMQFYNPTTSRLPIPQATPEEQQNLSRKAIKMLELHKNLYNDSKSTLDFIQSKYDIKKISKKLEKFYLLDWKQFGKELKKQKVKLTLREEKELKDFFDEEKIKFEMLEEEINNLDDEINKEIYNLYGLTEEEVNIINS